MAAEPLPQHLIEAGRNLLLETDRIGLAAQGAAWLRHHGVGDWRYYLVTGLVDTVGPTRVYDRLAAAFPKLNVPSDLTIMDVHLGSPRDEVFQKLRRLVETPETTTTEFTNCTLNGMLFDAVVYRMESGRSDEEMRRVKQRFSRTVRRLVSA